MKKLALKQMENIEGGKFWGTGSTTTCNGIGYCLTCDHNYYFWFRSKGYNCKGSQM